MKFCPFFVKNNIDIDIEVDGGINSETIEKAKDAGANIFVVGSAIVNKDNYEDNRLTSKQEKFVEGILQGKSQYESYLIAYPKAKEWQRNTVDSRASVLMNNKKIVKRLEEAGYKQEKKIMWTRQKALETINYVMDMNK